MAAEAREGLPSGARASGPLNGRREEWEQDGGRHVQGIVPWKGNGPSPVIFGLESPSPAVGSPRRKPC